MSEKKQAAGKSLLETYQFDDNASWFGGTPTKDDKTSVASVLDNISRKNLKEDDDDSTGAAARIDKPEKKKLADEEDLDLGNNTSSFFDEDDEEDEEPTTKPKKNGKKEKEEDVLDDEDEDDEDEDEEDDDEDNDDEEEEEEELEDKPEKGKKKPKPSKVEAPSADNSNEDDEDELIDPNDKEFYTSLATAMKKKGTFSKVEIPEDAELTEKDFLALQEEEVNLRVEEGIDEVIDELTKEMDEEGKAFMRYKKTGGKTADFIKVYSQVLPIEELDTDDEAQVKKVILHYAQKYKGDDAEEAQEHYDFLKTGGREVAKAQKYFDHIKKMDKQEKENLEKTRKEQLKQEQENFKAFTESLDAVVEKTKKIKGIALTDKDKKKLVESITKPTVKVKDKNLTPLQAKLSSILTAKNEEDRQRLLLLTKLVLSDFDFTDLEKKSDTKVAVRVAKGIARGKIGMTKVRSAQGRAKDLAEAFQA